MSTGFIQACYRGHTEIVSLLLQDSRIDVNKGDNDGWTGFMYACCKGHTETVRLLLEDSRIDVSKAENDGKTGFMLSFELREMTMTIASLIVRHSPEMHRKWWEMRVGYLCRQLASHTFMRDHKELYTLLDIWERLFTYTTNYPRERSRGVWKRELGEERWREGCDVMRENDTINALSLFFFSTPQYSWMRSYQDNFAYRDLMDAFYPRIPYSDIEKAFTLK